MQRVSDIEKTTFGLLSYHATTGEMRQTILDALKPKLDVGAPAPLIEHPSGGAPIGNEPRASDSVAARSAAPSIKEQLGALFREAGLYPSSVNAG
jgi:hypothetical protein